jgi:hypothetical protein
LVGEPTAISVLLRLMIVTSAQWLGSGISEPTNTLVIWSLGD